MSYTPKPGSNTERLCNAIFDADGPINSRDLEAASGVPTNLHNGCLEAPIRYGLISFSTERPANGGRRERLYRWAGQRATTTGTLFAPKPIRPYERRHEGFLSRFDRAHVPLRADVESPTTAAQAPEVGAPATARDTQVGGDHYRKLGIQPWDVVDTWPLEQRIGFYRGNALKYLQRLGSKDAGAQEARKAGHYCQKLAETLEGQ